MKSSNLRYKIYQALLESDLAPDQREALLEGWFDNLKDWLGAVKDTAKTDVSKIFSNNKYSRRVKTAADNITKELEGLKAIAKDAGVPEEVALELLNSILSSSGAEPEKISKAAETPSAAGGTGASASPKPGSPIAANDSSVAAIVRAAAAASGQDPEKVAAQAQEKKIDSPKASKALAKAISQQTKTNPEVAEKVINWLIKNNHLLAEGGRSISETVIFTAVKKSRIITESISVEKWGKIAGLLVEADDKKKEAAKKQFGDFLDDLRKELGAENNEEMSTEIMDILIALDDLDVIEVK